MGVISQEIRNPLRLEAVRRLEPLHRPPMLQFDRLTTLAAQILDAPVAMLTLVESDRQFFVSSYGLPDELRDARQTSIDYSLCQYAIASRAPLIVADAAADARLVGHPAVTEFGVGAYAGVPLVTPDEYYVGALCVIDFVPRDWAGDQMALLATLAAVCMDEMRLCGYERRAMMDREWGGGTRPWPAAW